MDLLLAAASLVVFLYLVLLLGRALFGWIMLFSPDWRPRGIALIAVEACFAATDPPLRFLRGFLPTVRVGGARLDLLLAWLILFSVCNSTLFLLAFARGA